MADFVIIGGGKIKKINGRFGGEGHGRGCDCSFSRRHLKLTAKRVLQADLEDLHFWESDKRQPPVSKPDVEYNDKKRRARSFADDRDSARDERPDSRSTPRVLSHPRAVYHNNRKVVDYGGGMRIVSAMY